MLRQLPRLRSLDLWLANVVWLADPDADGASWIDNGVWEWRPVPPLAGLPLRALTLQGALGLPPDWRQLAGLEELRVVSSPEYAEPWIEGDPHSCLQWGEKPAPGLTSLTRLEVKSVPPGGHREQSRGQGSVQRLSPAACPATSEESCSPRPP